MYAEKFEEQISKYLINELVMATYDPFRQLSFGLRFGVKRQKKEPIAVEVKKQKVSDTPYCQLLQQCSSSRQTYDKCHENDENFAVTTEQIIEIDTKSIDKKSRKRNKLKRQKEHQEEIIRMRKEHKIYVWGSDIAEPCVTFNEMTRDLSVNLHKNVENLHFESPTPIQMQSIPVMMKRRELLACAPTGSGKTLGFVLPILAHLEKPENVGFRAVIIEPTRELALQTYHFVVRLAENTGLKVHLIMNLEKAAARFRKKNNKRFDILVSTPKRVVKLLQREVAVLDLSRTEWLIVDESDKLFESGEGGFREQLAVIYQACDNANLRRAFFSATFSYEVEEWCKLNLDNVIMICVGARNSTVDTVEQELIFVGDEHGKLMELRNLFRQGLLPPILIFVQSKERAEHLHTELTADKINVDFIHSERPQNDRNNAVKKFRNGTTLVLICTELMGRGIDFKNVNLVINYDFPSSIINYIHRIGRTGRAGRTGKAVTFFTEKDRPLIRTVATVMRTAGCTVPDYMLTLQKPPRKLKKQLAKKGIPRQPITDLPKLIARQRKRKIFRSHKKTKLE